MGEQFKTYAAITADDMNAIRQLFTAYQQWLGGDTCFQDFQHELETLPGEFAPPNGRLFLAQDRATGDVVGVIGVQPCSNGDPTCCEMKRLYVVPKAQGVGLGRRLSEISLEFAKQAGYRQIRLETLPELETARQLYGTLGFSVDGTQEVISMSLDLEQC